MNKIFFLIFLNLALTVYSQDKIQEIQTITTNFDRVEIIKMKPGTDLLEGLNNVVKEKKIINAIILNGIGSVTDYHYHVVTDKNLPPAQEYPKASVAMDLIAVQGFVLNGRVHAHITLSDENSTVGGHLELGTKSLTFFILTIGVLPDNLEMENLDRYRY